MCAYLECVAEWVCTCGDGIDADTEFSTGFEGEHACVYAEQIYCMSSHISLNRIRDNLLPLSRDALAELMPPP